MNKFVTSALALGAAGTLAHASPPGDSEWLELDREISSLSSSLATAQDNGMGWSGLLRTTLTYSDDDIATGGGDDIFGFSFEDIDLAFWGMIGECGWRISADATVQNKLGDDFIVEDGYGWWELDEYVSVLMGNHKAHTLFSAYTDPENLLFINRTLLGSAFDEWQAGVAAWGTFEEMVHWTISVQNGANGQEADHRWTLRGEYELGEGSGEVEGSLGAGDDFAATVGVTYVNDDAQDIGDDNDLIALDARGTAGPIGFGGEVAFVGDDFGLTTDEDFSRTVSSIDFSEDGVNAGGSTPWALTLSYLLSEQFELAVRYQDTDNDDDTTVASAAVSYYQHGHNCKWILELMDIDSDSPAPDGTIWQLGLVVGSSGDRVY